MRSANITNNICVQKIIYRKRLGRLVDGNNLIDTDIKGKAGNEKGILKNYFMKADQ